MNAVGAFGLLLVLIWLIRSRSETDSQPIGRPIAWTSTDAWILLGVALLVVLAYARVATSYFLSDDFTILLHAGDYRRATWWAFTHPGGDGFYRPFFYLYFSTSELVAHRNPLAWHAIELAMHLANCWLVYLLAIALGWSRFAAGVASALFAIHGTRPEAVVGISAQPDLLATFFTLATLLLFLENRHWLAVIAMIPGLLSKESAYAIPLLLAVVAFGRWREMIPYWIAAAAMFLLRWHLMGGLGGYVNPDGRLEILSTGVLGVIKGLGLRLWAALFVPVNWSIRPGWFFGALLLAYLVFLLISARWTFPRRPIALSLAFVVVAALPAFSRLLIGADLAKAHYVYLPSAGFCLLMGTLVDRRPAAASVVMLFSIAALEHNLSAWKFAAERADAACEVGVSAVRSSPGPVAVVGLPHILNGIFFFHNGFPECVAMRTGIDPARVIVADRAPGGVKTLTWNPQTNELR
ncbi:MAG: hypothetical protein LAO79_20500 [Acidobacteriia bacterium]|nr:hypothetical protein [Terriglobia bacterium]